MTHDAGATWSTPAVISGDSVFPFVSVPTVTADGRIFVAFEEPARPRRTVATTTSSSSSIPATGARIAGPFVGRHPDRRLHRLPDRLRPPDLPGLVVPLLVRRQHRGRPHRRRPPRGRVVGHAQQHAAGARGPVRGGDQLRHRRQPVVRRAAGRGPTPWRSSCPATSSRAGRRTTPRACCGSASSTASTTRPTTSTATRSRRSASAGSLSFATSELTTARSDPTKDNRWFAATLEPGLPVRDDVHRRLLGDRRDAVRRGRRRLDRPPQPGLVRGPHGRRRGHVFRRVAVNPRRRGVRDGDSLAVPAALVRRRCRPASRPRARVFGRAPRARPTRSPT